MSLALDSRRWASAKQVADALGVHYRTVMRMVYRGEFGTVVQPRPGCVRIPVDNIEALLKERTLQVGDLARMEAAE